ncbi:hypothetical protein B0T21DRAFT_358403 [Apiosordaria backusii]|uniref:Uncharacterized protein n=1 Tax=Apiosordaria backusii TaxID=314023 RepID=A0AA40K3Q1_9PEZI|nr:hypothetical protein B0T21DRAFT_358403 [Apiosordaria backusii]
MARVNLCDVDFNNPSRFAELLGPNSALPIPVFKSPGDVRKETRERSQTIHETYNTLHAIVTRHEETIQKRWVKKSGQQRRKVLLECWPGMSAVHRPDFEAFRKETMEQRDQGTKYRESFMWPYINQEDLSKPKSLLLLLNARARHHPSHFAAADITAIRFGVVTNAIVRVFLNGYVMILNDAMDPDKYGELIAWDDHPDAFEWMHTQKQFLPGDGLIVLEIQERILRFLLDCSKAILHDIPEDKLTSGTYSVRPEPHLKTEVEANGFESLAVMAAETPYRLPARIDFKRMELLLEAKVSAAKDHIWALREDPGYFADRIVDIREHRQEMLKDIMGDIHPALRPGAGAIVGARVIANIVIEAYSELEIFTELHRQAKELRLLHDKHATRALRQNVVASPPMRRFFVRQQPPSATTSQIVVMSRPGNTLTKVEGHLNWLLSTLWEDGRMLFLADMPLVLDELERLLQTEPRAADLISSRIAEIISNASIISRCLGQINQYQPWARGFDSAEVDKLEGIQQGFAVWAKPLSYMVEGIRDQDFHRTKENVEALRGAERNLGEFWRAVDEIVDFNCEHLQGTVTRALLSEKRMLQCTPEWVDSGSVTEKKRQQRNAASGGVESLFKPLSTLYFSEETAGQPKVPITAKAKTKTKGESKETSLPPVSHEHVDNRAEPTPIRVDSRALKVFRTLFFNPGVTSSPGEVSWQDFIYAMTSTGLFSAEKLYGSAWQFQRLDTESQTRIQFHQPHPRGKIPFTMARRMGRRLTRAFGWIGGMFVLRENEDASQG